MATTTCAECEAPVSDRATTCPSCGYRKRRRWAKPLLFGLLALVALAGVAIVDLYRDQSSAYCAAIAQEIQRTDNLGISYESHNAQTRRQYEECR